MCGCFEFKEAYVERAAVLEDKFGPSADKNDEGQSLAGGGGMVI